MGWDYTWPDLEDYEEEEDWEDFGDDYGEDEEE